MAFQTPSPLDVWTRLRNAMRAFLPGTNAWIEPNNLSVVGRSFALALGSAYERAQYLYRQLFASTADAFHLEFRHAFDYGLARKQPAPAQGLFAFAQTGAPAIIPAGVTVTRADGVVFVFLADAVPDSQGLSTVLVRATTSGAVTNTLPNTPLSFTVDPLYPGLPLEGFVGAEGLGGGADVETDESLRARVLLRKRAPPHGGSRSDYEQWSLAVPGVTRVFVSTFKTTDPNQAASPLTLYPLFDDTRENGTPTEADLAMVAAALSSDRPVTARIYVAAAIPVSIDVQIAGLKRDTPWLRAAIAANLAALFRTRMPVATVDNAFTLPVAWINEAIARAEGYERHTLLAPSADQAFAPGQTPVLGRISYRG